MKDDWLTQFVEDIEREWVWRFRDLLCYKQLLYDADEARRDVLCRTCILLIYSHWEGFIKNTGKKFIKIFINEKIYNVPNNILVAHFIVINKKILTTQSLYGGAVEVLNKIKDNECICYDIEDIINTESNLNYKNLMKILPFIGINKDIFELKANYINNFVACRNGIAHGERRKLNINDIFNYIEDFIKMLNTYKEKLLDNAEKVSNTLNTNIRGD